MSTEHCYGCKYLTGRTDGAGGVSYGCSLYPGLVKGEDAHWSRDEDKQRHRVNVDVTAKDGQLEIRGG